VPTRKAGAGVPSGLPAVPLRARRRACSTEQPTGSCERGHRLWASGFGTAGVDSGAVADALQSLSPASLGLAHLTFGVAARSLRAQ